VRQVIDEFGPPNLQPRAGAAGIPTRAEAVTSDLPPHQGVRHLFGALGLATGQIYYRIRDRKLWREFRPFLQSLRGLLAGQKLYVIVDNFSPHKRAEVRDSCASNDVELVFLPTDATSTPNPNVASPWNPRSGCPITYRRLLDEALAHPLGKIRVW
jgi:hypothetical protein